MRSTRLAIGLLGLIGWGWTTTSPAFATAELHNDPKGFQGIEWGASLKGRPELKQTYAGPRVGEYEIKDSSPALDTIPVASLLLVTVEGKFARVTVRYKGEAVHKQVLAYLETRFGPLDKTPGQMVRGLNQQYNWRGPETEINLTYEGRSERGFVFFDSRTLAPRFNDGITDSAE
ncbi:hypothetical protein YTPLAS18_06620 [Nitrospira sp.]|nr:hypothetical protein YTPLAS18_06620 [Nitrospira sp.]